MNTERAELLDKYIKEHKPSEDLIRNLKHSYVGYDRYFEAELISHELKQPSMALDFGCGCGDYGDYFIRQGWVIDFYDFAETLDFVKYRVNNDKSTYYKAEDGWEKINFGMYDLIIFGEVLEHLIDPLKILQSCYNGDSMGNKVSHIFTSSYPYKQRNEFAYREHLIEAYDQQEECIKLLTTHYSKKNFGGQWNLWSLK